MALVWQALCFSMWFQFKFSMKAAVFSQKPPLTAWARVFIIGHHILGFLLHMLNS